MQTKSIFLALVFGILIFGIDHTQANEKPTEKSPLIEQGSKDLEKLAGFAGDYIVIDARRASDVASPLDLKENVPLGKRIRFGNGNIEIDGADCEDWRILPSSKAVVDVNQDPNLIDLVLSPTDSPISRGDQQVHSGFDITCEDEWVFSLHKVDDRVLVMPVNNSSLNLILERPLSSLQIKAYQMQLKSMKFYSGRLTGELDEATLRASRFWYIDRSRLKEDQPVPARPAITENLLDALKILGGK